MAFWDAFKGIAVVEIVVGCPVPSFDLVVLQFSISDVGGNAPEAKRSWIIRASEFLASMSTCHRHEYG